MLVTVALLAGCGKTDLSSHVDGSADDPGDTDEQLPFPCGFSEIADIHGTGSGNVWAVGDGGCVLHFDGADWIGEAAPAQQLDAVHAVSDEVIFAVGGDVVWRRSASGWEDDLSMPGAAFTDVWADSESFVVAVGKDTASGNGVIALRDGDEWNQVTPWETPPILSVWGEHPGSVWVGGEEKLLLHLDGTEWLAEQTGYDGDYAIRNLIGRGEGELWFVAFNSPYGGGMAVRRTVDGDGTPGFQHFSFWGDWTQGFYEAIWTAPQDVVLAGAAIILGDMSSQFRGLELFDCDPGLGDCHVTQAWEGPEGGPERLRAFWGVSGSEIYIAGPTDDGPGLWKRVFGLGTSWEKVWG
jgi:hypothetical protein